MDQRSEPDPHSAGPLRTQAASRPPPGYESLALQSGRGPRADPCCARECARPRVRARVPGGGSEALVLERAGFWNSPPRPAGIQPGPADCNRPWRGRPRRARAPRATAPDSSPAPRGQVRRGGRGLRLPGPLPPGRRRWPARQAAPARPRPAPRARPAAQLYPSWKPKPGGCTRAERTAAAAAKKEAAAAAQLRRARQARRSPHGRTRTAGGARARSSRRRTRGGAGALPGKVKLEPEAARRRWGPEERRPAPRCAQP